MWTPEQVEIAVVELTKLGTVRGIKLDPRALIVWAEALAVYAFDFAMDGIRFLKTEWPKDFLSVPLIIEAANESRNQSVDEWWKSDPLTLQFAATLGLKAVPGESWDSLRARMRQAIEHAKRQEMLERPPIQAVRDLTKRLTVRPDEPTTH